MLFANGIGFDVDPPVEMENPGAAWIANHGRFMAIVPSGFHCAQDLVPDGSRKAGRTMIATRPRFEPRESLSRHLAKSIESNRGFRPEQFPNLSN